MEEFDGAHDIDSLRDKIKYNQVPDEADFSYLGIINEYQFNYKREYTDTLMNIDVSYAKTKDPITLEIENYACVAVYS